MKTNLIGLAVAVTTLTSFAAFANDWDDDDRHDAPGHHCELHAAVPVAPAPQAGGRYELQNTQRWIPDRYEQVTVQQCREKRHGRHGRHGFGHRRCFPVTQSRLVPGQYQTVQEWVWVPAHAHQEYSQYPGQRPPLTTQGRVGFRFGIR